MQDYPRDETSGFNHITSEAVSESVLRLFGKVPGLRARIDDGHWRGLRPMLDGHGGWNIAEALQLGALCAFLLGLSDDDYDAALIRQGLADRGFVPGR